jgi:hypothetical protein
MSVRLSALRSGRALHPEISSGTSFCYRLSKSLGNVAAGRFRYIEKKYNDLIGTRTRDLLAWSIVLQPSAIPCSFHDNFIFTFFKINIAFYMLCYRGPATVAMKLEHLTTVLERVRHCCNET